MKEAIMIPMVNEFALSNLLNHSGWFCILKKGEEAISRLAKTLCDFTNLLIFSTKLSLGRNVIGKKLFGIQETEEGRRIEINFERVSLWTLVFTNAFFASYFFAKLFYWV